MIRKLPSQVCSKLRSGVAITCPTQCVEELVLNSLDAGATCVAVRVDLSCFRIQVVDNGSGIMKEELQKLGERYFTSKCHEEKDLDNLCYYGFRGEALSSLRDMSFVLEVVSRNRASSQTFCKLFHKGKPLAVKESKMKRPCSGSTVTVHDLFYNLPVRRKATNENLEVENIRMRLESISLMQPHISFTMRNDCTGSIILQTHKSNGLLSTFSHLFGTGKARLMSEVKGTKGHFSIEGFIGKEGYSKKNIQFVYINSRMILKSRIHKLMNQILKKSMLLKRKTGNNTSPQIGSSIPVKSTDVNARYALYVMNIHCPYSEYDITFDPTKTLVEFKDWECVTTLIEDVIHNFLQKENLFVRLQAICSQKNNSDSNTDLLQDWCSSGESPDLTPNDDDNDSVSYAKNISTKNARDNLMSKMARRKSTQKVIQDEESILSESISIVPVIENDEVTDQKTCNTECNSDESGTSNSFIGDIILNHNDRTQKCLEMRSSFSSPTSNTSGQFQTAKSCRNETEVNTTSEISNDNTSPQLLISVSPKDGFREVCVGDSEDPLGLLEYKKMEMKSTVTHQFQKQTCPTTICPHKVTIDTASMAYKSMDDSGYLSFESEDPLGDRSKKVSEITTTEKNIHVAVYEKFDSENNIFDNRSVGIFDNSVMDKSFCSNLQKRKSIVENVRKMLVQKDIILKRSFQHTRGPVSLLQNLRKFLPENKLQNSENQPDRSFQEMTEKHRDPQDSIDLNTPSIVSSDGVPTQQQEFLNNISSLNTKVLVTQELKQIDANCPGTFDKIVLEQDGLSSRKRGFDDNTVPTTASKLSRLMRQTQLATNKDITTINRHSVDFQLESFRNHDDVVDSPPTCNSVEPEQEVNDDFFTTDTLVQTGRSVLDGIKLYNVQPRASSEKSTCQYRYPMVSYSNENMNVSRSELQDDHCKLTKITDQSSFRMEGSNSPCLDYSQCADVTNQNLDVSCQFRSKDNDLSSTVNAFGTADISSLNNQLTQMKDDPDSPKQTRTQESSCSFPETQSDIIFCGSPYGCVKQSISSKIPFSHVHSEGEATSETHHMASQGETTTEPLISMASQLETTAEIPHCMASQGFCPSFHDTTEYSLCSQGFTPSEFVDSNNKVPSPSNSTGFSPCLSVTQHCSLLESANPHLETDSCRSSSHTETIGRKTENHPLAEMKNHSSFIEDISSVTSSLHSGNVEHVSSADSASFTQLMEKHGQMSQNIAHEAYSNNTMCTDSEKVVKFIDLFQHRLSEKQSIPVVDYTQNKQAGAYDNEHFTLRSIVENTCNGTVEMPTVTENSRDTESVNFEKSDVGSDIPDRDFEKSGNINQVAASIEENKISELTVHSNCVDSVDLFSDRSATGSSYGNMSHLSDIDKSSSRRSTSEINVTAEISSADSSLRFEKKSHAKGEDICDGIVWEEEMDTQQASQCLHSTDENGVGKRESSEITEPVHSAALHEADGSMSCNQTSDTPEPVWCPVTDPGTGNLIRVNSLSGHTMDDRNWNAVTKKGHVRESSPENEKPTLQMSNKNWKKTEATSLSQSSHNALLTMMEEHFDEGMAVKWKESHVLSSGEGGSLVKESKCVADLLEEWDNPVFSRPEKNVLAADEVPSTRTGRKVYRTLNPCRFTKSMLSNLRVLGQVDNKFIACLMNTEENTEPDLLVLIDQHAAHERVRLEQLTTDATDKKGSKEGKIITSNVKPPELLHLCQEEIRLMSSFKAEFIRIGIEFTADKTKKDSVWIHAIPACIMQREASERKRKRDSMIWDAVETLIKEHIELLKRTHGATGRLPQTIHKILCSQACHGAIKFGDLLTLHECEGLLQSLSTCKLPFQCAHGRPSVMPLLSMKQLQRTSTGIKRPRLWRIAKNIQDANV